MRTAYLSGMAIATACATLIVGIGDIRGEIGARVVFFFFFLSKQK